MSVRRQGNAGSRAETFGLKLLQSVREMKARNFARTMLVPSHGADRQSLNRGGSDAEV